jgi:YidC/Oxa1 family membrane protein insertase
LGQIWDFLIVQPIALLLRSLYSATGSFGVSIIIFGLVAKAALLWFAFKAKRGMLQQQRLQPKLQELQKQYGRDRQKMQQEQAKLYQSEGISMFGGCLWMFVPFPIIIALYGAVRRPLTYIMELSGDAIASISEALGIESGAGGRGGFFDELVIANALNDPGNLNLAQNVVSETLHPVNFSFLGINLAEVPSFAGLIVLVPLVSALSSFLSVWLTQKFTGRPPAAGNAQIMMFLLGPGISLWLGFTLPAALGVYWITQNVLGVPQEYVLSKYWNRKLDAEDAAKAGREERRKAAEAIQKEEDRQRRAERIAAQNQKHKPKRYKLQNKTAGNDDGDGLRENPVQKEDTEDDE